MGKVARVGLPGPWLVIAVDTSYDILAHTRREDNTTSPEKRERCAPLRRAGEGP